VPDAAQRQLSDALTYISQSDFPDKWPTLMPELVSKLASPDVKVLVPRVPSPLRALIKCHRSPSRACMWADGHRSLHLLALECSVLSFGAVGPTLSPPLSHVPLSITACQVINGVLESANSIFKRYELQGACSFGCGCVGVWGV
jgi:hypothetical protein